MILIAESGSTKCDWAVLGHDGKELKRFSTMGFNPYFHTSELVHDVLSNTPEMAKIAGDVTRVFFYGAGSSTGALRKIIRLGLEQVFPKAAVKVDHDLEASAYSTYDGRPAITCILGTGSNSCYFDGESVHEEIPSLAYILGDEGSASNIGKRLVADYLYKRMPKDLAEDFKETYGVSKDDVITSVYNKPDPNVYLASYSRFAGKHIAHSYIQEIIYESFSRFVEVHVGCFANHKEVPVHFVGSTFRRPGGSVRNSGT